MKDYKFPYWGPFVLETKVEQKFLDVLLEKGNESREKNLDNRKKLAGVIDNEYYYEDYEEWFIPKFTPYLDGYMEGMRTIWMPKQKPIKTWCIKSLWINYQKANEYNPPHNHADDLSFVIYLKVPAKLKKELKESVGMRTTAGPGTINFVLLLFLKRTAPNKEIYNPSYLVYNYSSTKTHACVSSFQL